MAGIECPMLCGNKVTKDSLMSDHIDSGCTKHILTQESCESPPVKPSPFFTNRTSTSFSKPADAAQTTSTPTRSKKPPNQPSQIGSKRPLETPQNGDTVHQDDQGPASKRRRLKELHKSAPLAERMRPRTLDHVCGQELVGPEGILRGLIAENRVPSMILWGGPGTGKTTIARLIAHTAGCRLVEINATSTGVQEVKKLFVEAQSDRELTGRKTIVFCDEIHRYSKSQQDIFLGPVESGQITLIGATTENPSFKVINALMSRCRTFTLSKLNEEAIVTIMQRAVDTEYPDHPPLIDKEFLEFLSAFSDGDARTALNILELAFDLSKRPAITAEILKKSLTQTLVYDRNGDQHYDSISAFHKSIRGSDPDATLYYLARMLQSGEDPLYVARRLIVISSEDIGLADNTMLPLAISTYTACEKIGMPEARICLAHCSVAFALAPKSTRAYRGMAKAMEALKEPGKAGLPIPSHLRNAPTRLMKEIGYGAEYKYNPDYLEGRVVQEYLPEKMKGETFLEDRHLGAQLDPDINYEAEETKDEI
ncbi:putative aaa family protein [Venturia nashicola]|uniref:Putative aaa family protein n=1 Tax=Venturia nashicola TaxID=86259 RepID=A0A4Z1PLG1_9PEZI|nr:putative aaa family protein [Venturia nashicola]TLD36839.1 putative aaa family protein [Venturia nashicola]